MPTDGRRFGRAAGGGLAAFLLLGALNACGGDVSEDASCGISVEYNGRTYHEVHVEDAPKLGATLGEADMPDCPDSNLASPGPPSRVTVRRVVGVSPQQAIAWENLILLAPGMTALPSPSASP